MYSFIHLFTSPVILFKVPGAHLSSDRVRGYTCPPFNKVFIQKM